MAEDQGSFASLVFTVTGGIGGQGRAFCSRLAILLKGHLAYNPR